MDITGSEIVGEKKGESKDFSNRQETGFNQGIESIHSLEGSLEKSSAEDDSSYQRIMSKVKGGGSVLLSNSEIKNDAREMSLKADMESQLKHLVDVATIKGVPHAVKVAKHFNEYMLDAFHDELVDKFHDALVEKGLIEKE